MVSDLYTLKSPKVTMGDRFTLEWADYKKSVATTFVNARISQDFTDVTLVGSDFELEAHRLVLSSGSDFFHQVFNRTKHHHPFVYLKGIPKVDIESILSFLYNGEAIVAQEDLEHFILTAKELGVRGVEGSDDNVDVSTKQNSDGSENGGQEHVDNQVVQQNFQRRSSAWSHFERITESLATCNLCGKEVQTKGSNTSGLWRHMASAHKDMDIKKEKGGPIDDAQTPFKGDDNLTFKGSNDWMRDNLSEDINQPEGYMKTTTKRLHVPRSRIWEQYTRLPEDVAVCKTCNRLRLMSMLIQGVFFYWSRPKKF